MDFTQFTQPLITSLQSLMIPGAIIGILFGIFAFLVGPFLPGLSNSTKGYLQMALIGVAFAGFVPALVTAVAGIGAGAGGG